MLKSNSSRLTVVGIAVAVLIVVAGGLATASNMGFKLNTQIVTHPSPIPGGLLYRNWVSVPYNNPYGNAGAFCTMTGLNSSGLVRATVAQIPAGDTGIPSTQTCGTATANAMTLIPGAGLQVTNPNGGLTSIIVVGSHNPTLGITVPDAPTTVPTGNFWFSVPYHTTAVTMNDLCLSAGLTSSGLPRAAITMLTRAQAGTTGVPSSATCGTSTAANTNLELGTFVQIREPNGPKTFIPAHF
jgi:hypothetical protein